MIGEKDEKKPDEKNTGKITLARLKKYLTLYRNKAGRYWFIQFLNPAMSSVISAVYSFLYRDVVNAVTAGSYQLLQSALWLAGAFFVLDICMSWTYYLHMYYTRHIMQELQTRVFRHLQRLPMSYFDARHSAESVQKVCVNTNHLKNALANYHPRFISVALQGAFAIAFIMFLDWRLGLISIAISIISLRINLWLTKPLHGMAQKIQKAHEICTTRLIDLLAGVRVIHLFPGARRMLELYEDANEGVAGSTVKRYGRQGAVSGVGSMFAFASGIGVLLVGIFMVRAGLVDLGTVMAVSNMQGMVGWFLGAVGRIWGDVKECFVLADRVFEVLDEPLEEKYDTPCAADFTGLRLENAEFSYDGIEKVLSGISIDVKKGETIALVGASGGGKSTVTKIFLGFYGLTGGGAGVLGKAIGSHELPELRERIAYVPQDAYLFACSVKENRRYGRPDATDDEIIAAAERAYAHDFIMSLKDGYDSLVGERGESLSGGQRQRVAIARAFVKNAPVLLLDEATSALDSESEHWVQKGLEALMQGRTTLVVAHRLSTIRNADRIYVIENGAVCEEGGHESLMESSGVYSRLVNMSGRM